MERLTSNKDKAEMSMVELAHNSCYAKDGKAWYREYGRDTDARVLARKMMIYFTDEDIAYDSSDEDFDEYMADRAALGWDCVGDLVALFYRNMWAMADLHARLKHLEDLKEQGRLLELPCAVGDIFFCIDDGSYPNEWEFVNIQQIISVIDKIGKTIFLTREEAEEALERMEKL